VTKMIFKFFFGKNNQYWYGIKTGDGKGNIVAYTINIAEDM
jgi:hypothetical protein